MDIEKKKRGAFKNMIYICKQTWLYKKSCFFIILFKGITATLILTILNYTTKYIVADITAQVKINELIKTIAIFVGALFVTKIFDIYLVNKLEYLPIYVRFKQFLKLNKLVNTMDYEMLESPKILDAYQLASRAADGNYNGLEGMIRDVDHTWTNILKIVSQMIILSFLSIWLALIPLVICFIQYLIFVKIIKIDKEICWTPISPYWRKMWYMKHISSDFKYAKDIRTYNMTSYIHEKHQKVDDEAHSMIAKSKNLWIKYGAITHFSIILLINISIYAFVVYKTYIGEIDIANCVFYISSAYTLFQAISGTFYSLAGISRHSLEVDDYRNFMEMKVDKKDITGKLEELNSFDIEFKNVSFKYPNQQNWALKNVSIKIPYGTKLAVVGLNGAGKSTFIKLLLRLYEPTEGEILIDGKNINSFDKDEYYKLFAPLFQNVEMYAMKINENVSMKLENDTNLDKVSKVLSSVGLMSKIKDFPLELQTPVLKIIDENGVDFSGGEKQKIALARALYKESKFIILDEPTSALDALAEYELYLEFNNMVKDKTAVFISHRLSSTQFCDYIAYFADGSIVEYGSHEELMKQNGKYKDLFNVQSKYYKEDHENETNS